jgi:hypothetical protein
MNPKNQHVIPVTNGWAVKKEGNDRYTVITETKKQAVEVASEIARQNVSSVIIHDEASMGMKK